MQRQRAAGFLLQRRDDGHAVREQLRQIRMLFQNRTLTPPQRAIKFHDDLRARRILHAHAIHAILIGVQLEVLASRAPAALLHRVEHEVGSQLIKKILLVQHAPSPIIERVREITQIENHQVEIWRRAYQRSLNLTVRPDGRVRVTCGRRVSQREIARFVRDSQVFIQKRMLEVEQMKSRFPKKEFVSGETFLFFGERIPLQIVWTWTTKIRMQAEGGVLEMLAPVSSTRDGRHKALVSFFRKQSRLHLSERLTECAIRMSLVPMALSIRGQRTRWGSCTARGEISLNWKLLSAPEKVIDYVVIHELAHIVHMNHSSRFWDLVAEYDREWKTHRRWLKDNEFEIGAQFR
jgi:predicted metal-dependent hydrolase